MRRAVPSPFAFPSDEKDGFVRLLGQLAIHARFLVSRPKRPLSQSVHDMRVLIKHLRALLSFVRPIFSSAETIQIKSHLRKASHLLAAQRELAVMRSIIPGILRKTLNPTHRKLLIRILRIQNKKLSLRGNYEQLKGSVSIFLMAIHQMKRNAKIHSKWSSFSHRLDKTFRATKKSGKKALKSRDAVQFHDWRKKAKSLLYQLQFTHAFPGKRMAKTIQRVDKLQEKLGDYHDSVVAQNHLKKSLPDDASLQLVKHSVSLLEKRKCHLQKKIENIAQHIKYHS